MGGSGIQPCGQHRHDCRVVTPVFIFAFDSGVEYLGSEFVFGESGLDDFIYTGMHQLDDAGRATHVTQFLRRLDNTLPVNQRGSIDQCSPG